MLVKIWIGKPHIISVSWSCFFDVTEVGTGCYTAYKFPPVPVRIPLLMEQFTTIACSLSHLVHVPCRFVSDEIPEIEASWASAQFMRACMDTSFQSGPRVMLSGANLFHSPRYFEQISPARLGISSVSVSLLPGRQSFRINKIYQAGVERRGVQSYPLK